MNRTLPSSLDMNTGEARVLRFLYKWIRPIRVGDLARQVGIVHQTLNSMLTRMEEEGLVVWKRHGPVRLTEQGQSQAAHYDHHHNLVEHYFLDTLDLSAKEAHAESLRIAPLVSCNLISAICAKYAVEIGEACEGRQFPDSTKFCVETLDP